MNTVTTIQKPEIRLAKWETNYNNKMGCQGFLHLDLMPGKMLSMDQLSQIVVEIETVDGSHPKIQVQPVEIQVFRLWWIPEAVTMASHGMNQLEFIEFMYSKHKHIRDANRMDQQVAMYAYRRAVLL